MSEMESAPRALVVSTRSHRCLRSAKVSISQRRTVGTKTTRLDFINDKVLTVLRT